MAARQTPQAMAVLYVLMIPVMVFVLSWSTFGSAWLAAGLALLVVALPITVYLARPSVREGFALLLALRQSKQAAARGDLARAEERARRAVARADVARENRDLCLGMALSQLGEVYHAQGRPADAEPVLRQALKHFTESVPYVPARRAAALLSLSAVLIAAGRCAEAEPLCREALTVLVNAGDPARATAMLRLSRALAGQGKGDEAAEWEARARALPLPVGSRNE